jgi:glutamyl-tRNA synthetase
VKDADASVRDFVSQLIVALGERLKLFSDILLYDEYFVADDALKYDEKAFEKRITKAPGATELLQAFANDLKNADPFDAATLQDLMQRFVDARGLKLGDVIHAVRVAVSGKAVGPGMFECLELIGKPRCLKRIELAIARAGRETQS